MKNKERFFSKVDKTNTCWLWTGGKAYNGYGFFWLNGKQVRAHRYIYELINGEISKDIQVLHKCDVPACVNPDHLFLGTVKDNMKDKVNKGRSAKGMVHGRAKLTEEDIIIMRAWPKYRGYQTDLMKEFDISQAVISSIIRYKTWKHI